MPRAEDDSLIAPHASSMPDLSALYRKNILNHILNIVFVGGAPRAFEAATLLKNFVRLTDKSLEDYELARVAFLKYIARSSNTEFSHMFRAQGHMENCITALHRAVRHAEKIRRNRDFAGLVPALQVLVRQNTRAIAGVRNAVEHGEDRILRGKIKPGDIAMLWMDEDQCEIEGLQLSYDDLAGWLSELHTLASNLAVHRFQGSSMA